MSNNGPMPEITQQRAEELSARAAEIAGAIDDAITSGSLGLMGMNAGELENVQFSGLLMVIVRRALRAGIPLEHLLAGVHHTYSYVLGTHQGKPGGGK